MALGRLALWLLIEELNGFSRSSSLAIDTGAQMLSLE